MTWLFLFSSFARALAMLEIAVPSSVRVSNLNTPSWPLTAYILARPARFGAEIRPFS
jgi:hypothetical protein